MLGLLLKAAIVVGLSVAMVPTQSVDAREPRSRQWVIDYVRQSIADTPRNQAYMQAFEGYQPVDVEWFTGPQHQEGRTQSRHQTNRLGRNAFAYVTPGVKGHRDPQVLEELRQAYAGVVDHINEDGRFTWEKQFTTWGYESHEHGWRFEPLLIGYLWIAEELPAKEAEAIEQALFRAGEWLYHNPLTQHNNRGAVWVSMLTLAGTYFEQPEWLALAEQHADAIIGGSVLPDGEIGEQTRQYGGGGPDANYTYTGWGYVYMYRLYSGRDDLDPLLLKAQHWLATYNSHSGVLLVPGASVRKRLISPPLIDALPALERYLRDEPFFATLAERWRQCVRDMGNVHGLHIISPFIWAAFENGVAADATSGATPAWYTNHTDIYERPEVHYALIGRQYQAGITFRGRTREGYNHPLRGLQTFALGQEYPILNVSADTNSFTEASGANTAKHNIDKVDAGWELLTASTPAPDGDLTAITTRHGKLWTIYAITPASMVVVHGTTDASEPIRSEWSLDRRFTADPPILNMAKRQVMFPERAAQMHYLAGEATLELPGRRGQRGPLSAVMLTVTAEGGRSAFAFSAPGFAFDQAGITRERLRFSDATGTYLLDLDKVLNDSQALTRPARQRLQRLRGGGS